MKCSPSCCKAISNCFRLCPLDLSKGTGPQLPLHEVARVALGLALPPLLCLKSLMAAPTCCSGLTRPCPALPQSHPPGQLQPCLPTPLTSGLTRPLHPPPQPLLCIPPLLPCPLCRLHPCPLPVRAWAAAAAWEAAAPTLACCPLASRPSLPQLPACAHPCPLWQLQLQNSLPAARQRQRQQLLLRLCQLALTLLLLLLLLLQLWWPCQRLLARTLPQSCQRLGQPLLSPLKRPCRGSASLLQRSAHGAGAAPQGCRWARRRRRRLRLSSWCRCHPWAGLAAVVPASHNLSCMPSSQVQPLPSPPLLLLLPLLLRLPPHQQALPSPSPPPLAASLLACSVWWSQPEPPVAVA